MSFADIFYNNCFKNGLLAIELGQEKIDKLFAFAESGLQVEIDLINQNIHCSDEDLISFEIDEFRKQQILEGLDEVGISLKYSDEIKNFEKQRELEAPWVFKS